MDLDPGDQHHVLRVPGGAVRPGPEPAEQGHAERGRLHRDDLQRAVLGLPGRRLGQEEAAGAGVPPGRGAGAGERVLAELRDAVRLQVLGWFHVNG